MNKSLSEIFNEIGHFGEDIGHNDKGGTHSYVDVYESLLAPFRQRCDIMEIGLAMGKSMELWGKYFGPDCTITGMDLSLVFDIAPFDSRFRFIAGDATSTAVLQNLGEARFDIIIDDGSHMQADQEAAFRLLSPRVKEGGLYIIEDILSPESSVPSLRALHPNCEVIDLRGVKGRFDDMLLVYRF